MKLKPKFTPTENELVGRMRGIPIPEDIAVKQDDALMPSLEEKQLAVNAPAIEAVRMPVMLGKVNKTDALVFDEVERKAMLGDKGADWKVYGEHFLAVDAGKPEDTRMRYCLPFVKDGVVYAKSLIQACGSDSKEVAQAAWQMCKDAGVVTVEAGVGRPRKADMACPVMASGSSCPMNAAGKCRQLNDAKECGLLNDACALIADNKPACPMMAGGEDCPMNSWQGCPQLDEDAGCKLGDGQCCMVAADDSDEEK